MGITSRVLARFAKKDDDTYTWVMWINEVWDGGSKKVRNPNPMTKERYPEVTFDTAYGTSEWFREVVKKDYAKWVKQKKKDNKGEKPEPPKEKPQSEAPQQSTPKEKPSKPAIDSKKLKSVKKDLEAKADKLKSSWRDAPADQLDIMLRNDMHRPNVMYKEDAEKEISRLKGAVEEAKKSLLSAVDGAQKSSVEKDLDKHFESFDPKKLKEKMDITNIYPGATFAGDGDKVRKGEFFIAEGSYADIVADLAELIKKAPDALSKYMDKKYSSTTMNIVNRVVRRFAKRDPIRRGF